MCYAARLHNLEYKAPMFREPGPVSNELFRFRTEPRRSESPMRDFVLELGRGSCVSLSAVLCTGPVKSLLSYFCDSGKERHEFTFSCHTEQDLLSGPGGAEAQFERNLSKGPVSVEALIHH